MKAMRTYILINETDENILFIGKTFRPNQPVQVASKKLEPEDVREELVMLIEEGAMSSTPSTEWDEKAWRAAQEDEDEYEDYSVEDEDED